MACVPPSTGDLSGDTPSSLAFLPLEDCAEACFLSRGPNAALHLRRCHRDRPQPPNPTPRRPVQAFVGRWCWHRGAPGHPALLAPPPSTGARPHALGTHRLAGPVRLGAASDRTPPPP